MRKMSRQMTVAIAGLGSRGRDTYAKAAKIYPDKMKIVAIADIDPEKVKLTAEEYDVPMSHCYESAEDMLKEEKLADAMIIATQDRQHVGQAIKALKKGYHLLLEKPISPDLGECRKISEVAKECKREVVVCHVLRYTPIYQKVKEILDAGTIGDVISIMAIENVGWFHQAHSFVRGNWRNAEESSPMILQKCCHDMDIMLWLADSKCESLSSFGELSYFTEENAPEGAPAYCLDGCPHRDECAFYAPRFYLENLDGYLVRAVTDQTDPEHVLEALKKGPYGRCVFHCDNTVVDHQSVDIKFENQVTASFLMTAFTDQCARRIRLMGTKGEIKGDMDAGTIEIRDFVSGNLETIELHTPANGHNGSDMSMMHDFVRMVGEGRKGKTDAAVSVESHLMALAAEEARITGQVVNLRGFANENK